MDLSDEFYAPIGKPDFVEIAATPSSGCIYCDLELEPVKLRRRWVHHFPRIGTNIACTSKNLKPAA
jgi:hypothetical protein